MCFSRVRVPSRECQALTLRVSLEVAEEVDAATKKYKADSEEVTRRTGVDPSADPTAMGGDATRELHAAMSLLPEMQERKRRLDIHTHVATTLLGQIKQRDLHSFHKLEQASAWHPGAQGGSGA